MQPSGVPEWWTVPRRCSGHCTVRRVHPKLSRNKPFSFMPPWGPPCAESRGGDVVVSAGVGIASEWLWGILSALSTCNWGCNQGLWHSRWRLGVAAKDHINLETSYLAWGVEFFHLKKRRRAWPCISHDWKIIFEISFLGITHNVNNTYLNF
jgi:hypothetical protein